MIKQTIVGFIITSELDGKYWTDKYTTDDLFQARVYKQKPKHIPRNRIKQVRVTIEELPYELDW